LSPDRKPQADDMQDGTGRKMYSGHEMCSMNFSVAVKNSSGSGNCSNKDIRECYIIRTLLPANITICWRHYLLKDSIDINV
jgi:hypothetical protein